MRTQPRHIRMKPYNRAYEAQLHRVATEAQLSLLEQTLEGYRGMPTPHYRMYPQGYFMYETQH